MERITLELPGDVYRRLSSHLLPAESFVEEAAFAFVRQNLKRNDTAFEFVEWLAVKPEGFVHRSEGYLELTDETRGLVIKRAHDLDASIAEFHSHPYPWPARFSISDREGLREFVPHVRWRLKGKPYLATVFAPTGFDTLVWMDNAETPRALHGMVVEGRLLRPTGLSIGDW